MKIKQGKSLPIPECTLKGKRIIAARTKDLLILDCYDDGTYKGRYMMNVETGEYGLWRNGHYSAEKLYNAWNNVSWYYSYCKIKRDEEDDKVIVEALQPKRRYEGQDVMSLLSSVEREYVREKSWKAEQNRLRRLHDLMNSVADVPEGFENWAAEVVWKDPYPTYKRDGAYICPKCGKKIAPSKIKVTRHNEIIPCTCGKELMIKKRGRMTKKWSKVMLIQETTGGQMIIRFFDVQSNFGENGYKIFLSEAVRLFESKGNPFRINVPKIYFNQWGKYQELNYQESNDFDVRNPANRQIGSCYLYPSGIQEAMKKTRYESVTRLLIQMSSAKMDFDYNKILKRSDQRDMIGLIEYLYKGRFYELLRENLFWMYGDSYRGNLNIEGKTIEEIMKIRDRQKINRLRNRNGGELERRWFEYTDETDEKISDAFLEFANKAHMTVESVRLMLPNMSPEQLMNYIKKQRDTSYPENRYEKVVDQWKDYLLMCKKLGKNMNDEMVYRPRELKRRHDEAVEEIRKLDMVEEMMRDAEKKELRAKELREKYPGTEQALKEIAPKYEYENEAYKIIVPKNLVDIMSEGNALHHCVGSTDRYFERIRDQETYICFLRRQEEPELPYYTIEVEPGGTIRQHRGMYDEEPNIEEIRGFLREWQKVLKKRLHGKDWKLAAESKIKREQNLEELRKANNERVLKGLAEDFMEAM